MAAVTKAPPYPTKQKFSDAKMRDILPLLSLPECLKIEYRANGVWFKMISKRSNFSYNCECCGVDNVGPKPITDHVRGKKHRLALQTADQLFHPNYTVPKGSNVPPRTPILDAYNDASGVIPAKGKAGTGQKTAVQQKAIKVVGGSQKTAGAQQKGIAPQSKPVGGQQKTAGPPQKVSVQKSQQPAKPLTAVKKASPTEKTEQVIETKSNPAGNVETKTPNENQDKINGCPKEEKVATLTPVDAKNEDDDVVLNVSEVPEIVILDDDDDEEGKLTTAAGDLKNKKSQPVTTLTSPATAKPQRPQKSSEPTDVVVKALTEQQKTSELQAKQKVEEQPQQKGTQQVPQKAMQQPQQKSGITSAKTGEKKENSTVATSKKVINPAAIIAKSVDKEDDDNKPRYQQNRVLIPTIDKAKKKQQPAVTNNALDTADPSFSTKSFTTKASNDVEGIIGVEYVVKILKVYNDPEPFYECCLCEVVMDGVGMQTHLLGYNHRYKYLEKHFPTCFNQYKDHIGNIQVMGIILDHVAKAIETHHGRELPYECLSGEFRSNRHGVMTTVYSFRHASEYSGPSFTNVVDNKQIEEFYKQKNLYLPPKPDPKRKPTFDTRNAAPVAKRTRVETRVERPERPERPLPSRGNNSTRGGSRSNTGPSRRPYVREEIENQTMDDEVHKQMVEEFLQNTRGRSRSPVGGRRRRQRSRTRSRSPHHSSRRRGHRRSPSPLREGDIWQAYRHLVDRSKVELDQMYKDYRKDPEKHPLYDEEWRKFWKHRKEQMTREGLDYRNYDFQPEWVRYFAVRIEELYDEALEDIKISSRRRLILPMTNDDLEDNKYHVKIQPEEQEVEVIKPLSEKLDNKNSVVSVLRLLTALEDYLGSLGPKVVELLSKALLVEKSNPRDINEIVLNIENCTILETAMEKLKGVLIAGLLEGPKVRAFNNVISETEKILKTAYKIRQRNPQPVPQPVPAPRNQVEYQAQKQSYLGAIGGGSFAQSSPSNPMGGSSSSNVGSAGAAASLLSQIDKKELASKIAAALTAQGKTDFNPEQLQQLIAVYSLIDKKKRDSAAADKQKMTLSDTLTALLNPGEKGSGGMSVDVQPLSGRMGGVYSSNSNDRSGALSNSSISNFVSMLNRDNSSTGGNGNSGDSQMWQNLQNIQSSLRMQSNVGPSSISRGFNRGSMSVGVGGNNFMDDMSSGSNFNRSGFGAGSGTGREGNSGSLNFGQTSNMNFSRSGGNMGSGAGNNTFNGNLQGSSGNIGGFSRGDGRPGDLGGNSEDFTRGGSGGTMGLNCAYSRGSGGLGSDFGNGNNSSSFSRNGNNNFLGGGGGSSSSFGSSFISGSGLSGFTSGGGFGGVDGGSGYPRGNTGNSALGFGGNNGSGVSNFNRGGFGNSMNSNFNNPQNKNTGRSDLESTTFGSSFLPSQRNTGTNQHNQPMNRNQIGSANNSQSGNRGNSNWRNQ